MQDREDGTPAVEDRDYVQSLVRGLDVIRAFGADRPSMTLSEAAQRTGMTRAAARRFLLTLVRAGYAETDGKHFRLRPKVLDLGFSYMSSLNLWEIAEPVLRELSAAIGETCSASVLEGHEIVYITFVPMARVITVGLGVGSRLPAFCSSMGRVMIADLPDDRREAFIAGCEMTPLTPRTVATREALREAVEAARRRGWALVDQEIEIGLRSLAVPVRSRWGRTVAAINTHVQAGRMSPEEMVERLLPPLVEASRRITASMTG